MDIEKARRIFDEPEPFIAEQWLRFLSDEQMALEENILESIHRNDQFQFHIILGGAGTGKTQVLLLLADELKERGFKVGYFTSSGVRQLIEKAGLDMPAESFQSGAVHLVDDPIEVGRIVEAIRRARETKARAIVVAIDPFQWTERTAFLKLATILGDHDPKNDLLGRRNTLVKMVEELGDLSPIKHFLRTAYRQNEEAGTGSVNLSESIFQKMNPYVALEKKRQFNSITEPFVQNILNGLRHSSGGGKFQVFEDADETELWKQLPSLIGRSDRWDWTESILFVSDNNQGKSRFADSGPDDMRLLTSKPVEGDATFRDAIGSLGSKFVHYSTPALVRGQEFQDVIICVSKLRWKQFKTQKEGMGGPEWQSIMPIYTFVTRAIDTVTILVI